MFRHHVIWCNILNFNDIVFPALSIQTMHRTGAMVTESDHFSFFLFFLTRRHTVTGQVHVQQSNRCLRDRIWKPGDPALTWLTQKFIQPNKQKCRFTKWRVFLGKIQATKPHSVQNFSLHFSSFLDKKSWNYFSQQICDVHHSNVWAQLVPLSPACL